MAQSPVVSISPGGSGTITVGQSTSFSSTATDANGDMFVHAFHYQDPQGRWNWQGTAQGLSLSSGYQEWFGNKSSNSRSMSVTANATGTYYIEWAAADSGGWSSSSGYTLTVVPAATPPSINSQPQSQTVDAGNSATFSVSASGTAPLSYQWRKNGNNIPGATSSSFTISNAQSSDAANYYVEVSNSAGTAWSDTVSLTVNTVTLPVVSITMLDNQAVIGSSDHAVVQFTRSESTASALTIQYDFTGNAETWADYRLANGETMPDTFTIPAGASSATMSIRATGINNMGEPESAGFALIDGAAYNVGSPSQASFNIYTNDPSGGGGGTPVVTLETTDNVAVIGSSNYATVRFTRTGSTTSALTVQYDFTGNAETWADYRLAGGETMPDTFVIPAGSASATMSLRATGVNNLGEPETAGFSLIDTASYNLGSPAAASFEIHTTDPGGGSGTPEVTIVAIDNTAEIGSSTNRAVMRFTRTGSTASALTVQYDFTGNAETWADYRLADGETMPDTFTIPAGSASADMTLRATGVNNLSEPETAGFALIDGAAYNVGSPSAASFTIHSSVTGDPPIATVTTEDNIAVIGSSTNRASVRFSRTGSTASALTVQYDFTGSADTWADYRLADGETMPDTFTIPAGQASALMTLRATGVNSQEPETAGFRLIDKPEYNVGSPNEASFDIYTTDPNLPPVVTIVAEDNAATIGTTDYAVFRFSRTGGTAQALTVQYDFTGNAETWTDYRLANGENMPDTFTIPAGLSSDVMTIRATGTNNVSNPETAGFVLIDKPEYDVGTSNAASFSISDGTPVAAVPQFNPASGDFPSPQPVTITTSTPSSANPQIRYTTDDTEPTAASVLYTGPVSVTNGMRLKAKTYAAGYLPSQTAVAQYGPPNMPTAAGPLITPAGGSYTTARQVEMITYIQQSSNPQIRYTIDGSEPSAASTLYTAPLTISTNTTLKAKVFASGYYPSATSTARYYIGNLPQAAAPTFNPAGGSFPSGGTVLVQLDSPQPQPRTIRYTLDSSEPFEGSPEYTGPISLSADTVVRAIVFASDHLPSAVQGHFFAFGNSNGPFGEQPALHVLDGAGLQTPPVGATTLRVLYHNLLEIVHVNSVSPGSQPSTWTYANDGVFDESEPGPFTVTIGSTNFPVERVSFKRRAHYKADGVNEIRVINHLVLKLNDSTVIPDNTTVTVSFAGETFTTTTHPLRYSPAIHVNQEGYVTSWSKVATVGYYLGQNNSTNEPLELELKPTQRNFKIVRASDGMVVHGGTLQETPAVDFREQDPDIYQKVYTADFSGLHGDGERYYLMIPGMGASLPFLHKEDVALNLARTYALGLLHQRCGAALDLPFTRFVHGPCHIHAAHVPLPAANFEQHPGTNNYSVWRKIAEEAQEVGSNVLERPGAQDLTAPEYQNFPFVRSGPIDVSGGHHDAGDYSKYTYNSADLVHLLMFAVDHLAGVSDLQNLGLPPTNGVPSGLMELAMWEADFLLKMQDDDGAFYYLVYPREGEYESTLPHDGVEQVVWPKTTVSTGAAVAALAQIGSSPRFKAKYPAKAATYRQAAIKGWELLVERVTDVDPPQLVQTQDGSEWKTVPSNAYQRLEHFGEEFADMDELAWAAAEIFAMAETPALRDQAHQKLTASDGWFPDPEADSVPKWGWKKLDAAYGNAIRSYAFAACFASTSGYGPRRLESEQDAAYLAKCRNLVRSWANTVAAWADESGHGISYAENRKPFQSTGWMMAGALNFDLAVGYQLTAYTADTADDAEQPILHRAMLRNFNYEGGSNPLNRSFLTGFGRVQQRIIAHQYSWFDRRATPVSGIPWGFVQSGPPDDSMRILSYPSDADNLRQYPLFDRWTEVSDVAMEFTHVDIARGLAAAGYLAAMTTLKNQSWTPVTGTINVANGTATLTAPGIDFADARIYWETPDTVVEKTGPDATTLALSGTPPWVEAEARFSDGRRVFAAHDPLPRVSVVASDNEARISDQNDKAVLTFTRTGGDQNQALRIYFKWTGRAASWDDFRAPTPPGSQPSDDVAKYVDIPAQQSSATVQVTAIANVRNLAPDAHYAHAIIEPASSSYVIGTPAGAIINFKP